MYVCVRGWGGCVWVCTHTGSAKTKRGYRIPLGLEFQVIASIQ